MGERFLSKIFQGFKDKFYGDDRKYLYFLVVLIEARI